MFRIMRNLVDFTFLANWWSCVELTFNLENPEDFKYFGKEHVIPIVNHKNDIDWLIGLLVSHRMRMYGVSYASTKIA